MNVVQNLVLKFMDYMRPSYTAFGGQFEGFDARNAVYVKVDRKLYFQDNLGVEYCLSDPLPFILANDGQGSGVDADTLDGLDSNQFAGSAHQHPHGHNFLESADTSVEHAVWVDNIGRVGIGVEENLDAALTIIGSIKAFRLVLTGGDLVLSRGSDLTSSLTAGLNHNVVLGSGVVFYIGTIGNSFTITGLTGGSDCRLAVLYSASNTMTIANNDVSSSAANRILTGTGSGVVIGSGNGIAVLIYLNSSWRLVCTLG